MKHVSQRTCRRNNPCVSKLVRAFAVACSASLNADTASSCTESLRDSPLVGDQPCCVQFLDTSLKTAPLAYFLLFASHWVFYGMFALAATKLRGVKGAARRPKIE